jgi:two-component system, NarL family, nitrate/nitrite response regulator NarL
MTIHNLRGIVLCDDHELFANGISDILVKSGKFRLDRIFTSSKECIKYLSIITPDILVCDLNIDTHDGFDILHEVKLRKLKTMVVFLTAYEEPFLVEKARKSGACAYISKSTSGNELLTTLLNLEPTGFLTNIKDKSISSSYDGLEAQFTSKYRLSKQEINIIKLVLEGKTSQEIGDALFISRHTAETHRRNIYKKLGISGFINLQQFARNHGIN